jgi:hypothetical protein
MRRSFPVLISAFVLAAVPASGATQSAQAKSPSELYKTAGPSVVLIEIYSDDGKVSGSGTGFIVSSDGAILTNYHVIAHTKRATVRLANDDAYDDVTVLDIDKRKDIALIKIKAVGLPYLTLGRSASAEVGDEVYVVGNPLGILQNTFSEGILSGIRQGDGYRLFQLSTPVSHGSSGSPVFDTNGNVIGIIKSTIEEGQNLNFAIPIDYVLGMLSSKEPRSLSSSYEPEAAPPKDNRAITAQAEEPQQAITKEIVFRKMKPYNDKNGLFTASFPDNWTIKNNSSASEVILIVSDPTENGIVVLRCYPSTELSPLELGKTLETFVHDHMSSLAAFTMGEPAPLESGIPHIVFHYTQTVNGQSFRMYGESFIQQHNGYVGTITLLIPLDQYSAKLRSAYEITDSFHVTGKK